METYITPKIGTKIFACAKVFDHAAKKIQSQDPWAQNIVAIGLLKEVKGRQHYVFSDVSRLVAQTAIGDSL